MDLHVVQLEIPSEANLIFGQSHFIKTVEDLHEALVTSGPGIRFGIAFCEASGDRLVRRSGNDPALEKVAVDNLSRVAAGHTFLVVLTGGFPINVMRAVQSVPEVCRVFCATANPVQVIVAETGLGRGVLGVVDGEKPVGVEGEEDVQKRKAFLRRIGYKL
jgi:adenosine/AMP kinase